MSALEPPTPSIATEILLVDDDPKTLLAMQAMLEDVGASLVTARSGRDALFKLLKQDFALILLDVQMPDLDGFETAELIRQRDRSRHTPIIFLTAFTQNDLAMLRGYALGAVDFLFKPIVGEILRSKVQVFVELQRSTQEVRRQAQLINEAEAREHARVLAEERQRWEADNLRAQMEHERANADQMARKAEELACAVAERDAAARALLQSNAQLTLLSDTANRLLTGHRPHTLLGELFGRLTGHLDLDVFAYRRLEDDEATLTLEAHGGLPPEEVEALRVQRLGAGVSGVVARTRRPLIVDEHNPPPEDAPPSFCMAGMTACVCYPLVAEERLIGTLEFGSRRRGSFGVEELAVLQMVADQIAIALERERLMNELQLRNARLADADRRKDEFLAMLAHELRNPLAPIVNALHIIEVEATSLGKSFSRAHATMDRQVRHLVRLVDDLLDVSRITQGKIELRRESARLQAVIEEALHIARPVLQSREQELVLELPDEPLPVWVDVTRMTQVVSNLVNNAAKYTNPRGTITVTAERGEEEVIVRVKDTGIGIRAEMLPRVFELFVQAEHASDRAAGGLGIGLTLVKRLVQMHGGDVLARSEGLGKGSEFIVTMPLGVAGVGSAVESLELRVESSGPNPGASNASAGPNVAGPNAAGPNAAGLNAGGLNAGGSAPESVTLNSQLSTLNHKRALRILVVEDNRDIRETLKELLEIEGHEVTLAEDGLAAVATAGNGHHHDVALVDIGLPGLDGYGVAEKLRDIQRQKGFPRRIIAMTGYGQAEDRRRALEAGFDDHLVKPVDPDMLTRLLAAQPIEGDA